MKLYEFRDPNHCDERATFANRTLKLLYTAYKGDLEALLVSDELKDFAADFDYWVRNIYEVIDQQIPLFALSHLHSCSLDNWDFTQEEWEAAVERTKEACRLYYS